MEIDLGKIPIDQDKIEGVIRYMNEGDAVLEVTKITGSCDCFLGIEGDKVLSPGHGGELFVKFDKTKIESGPVKRMVRFETNDPANPAVRVTFSFEIERTDSEEIRWLRKDLAEVKQQLALLRADMRLEPGSILQRCAEGMFEERTVKVYKDHLARDYENFVIGDSCDTGWKVRTFNVQPQPTMSKWNCHGSTNHAYNGSGTGSSSGLAVDITGWHRNTFTPPISWTAVQAVMARGDVVAYYAGLVIQHSATCLDGSTTWGANNEPVSGPETWRWATASPQLWWNNAGTGNPPFPDCTLLIVYDKP